jgi:hypothetical protein
MMAQPPRRALTLISLLVARDRRDSIIGDLLEEYHDTQSRERGVAAADRWFMRQALGFLWTAAALPGALLATLLTLRTLLDATVPIPDLANRAWITTLAAMALFTLTGFRLGLSTRRVPGAVITALAATIVGTVIAYAAALTCLAVAQTFVHPAATTLAGLREGLDVPAHVIALIGAILSAAGASAGRAFPKWPSPANI